MSFSTQSALRAASSSSVTSSRACGPQPNATFRFSAKTHSVFSRGLLPLKTSAYSNKETAKTPSANHSTFLSMKSSSLLPLQAVPSPSLAPRGVATRLSMVYDKAPVTGTKSFVIHSLLRDLHNASTIRVYSTALPSPGVHGSTWACMLTISYISQHALNPSSGSRRLSNPTSKSILWDA